MDKEKLKRNFKEKKVVPINIKISKSLSKWLKDENYSPTKLFEQVCKDLGYDDKKANKK